MDFPNHIQKAKFVIVNIVVTAVQGFLAAWAVTGNRTDKASLGAAVAAAASAAWNLALKPLLKSKGVL